MQLGQDLLRMAVGVDLSLQEGRDDLVLARVSDRPHDVAKARRRPRACGRQPDSRRFGEPRLASSSRPFDTGRGCDRSAEPERPAHPVKGFGRVASQTTDQSVLPSVVVEPTVVRPRLERRLSSGGFGPHLFRTRNHEGEDLMSNESEDLIRWVYEAFSRGDVATMLQFVDPDLEWTYLDPSLEDPEPQVCHGRHELETALERQAERGLRGELEEVVASGDRVMVVVRTPGLDSFRVRKADDRNYTVLTVREGRIVALRDCRDREEAIAVAALE